MKWPLLILLTICISCNVNKNSSKSDKVEKLTLFTVADDTTYSDEFVYVYKKNNVNNDTAFTRKDIKDYLDLYVNFKLKIKEAKSRGMDTTGAFKREFNTYKEQLKKPYLTENKVTEKLIKEGYDRYKQEINASHILVTVAENAPPADTLKAYNKIMEVREKAVSGGDFSQLAKEYSDDPSAKNNGGNLGYFTSFQMVYPFESAAYSTPEGEISKPVRTRFGYHIINVIDKRPTNGNVEVSHIMIRMKPDLSDSSEARNKIFEIYDQATGGVNWDDLAKQFSEDVNSKNAGGKLRPFSVGQLPVAFQEAAFALQNPGDISDPVMTPYGWHIIKMEGKTPLQSFEEMEPTIKSRINRDSRAQLSKKVFIERLKKEDQFEETEAVNTIYDYADSTLKRGKWSYNEQLEVLNKKLFSIAKKEFTIKDFFSYLKNNQKPNSYEPKNYMKEVYDKYTDEELISYEENHLEDKYEDYRMLVKEYKEGILLFQLMEEEVWNKAVEDSVGLKAYYEAHKDKYAHGEQLDVTIYNAKSEDIINSIESSIKANDSAALEKEALKKKYNQKEALALQVEEGAFEKGEKDVIDAIAWEKGIYKQELNGRYNLVVVKDKIAPGPKPLNNIKGLVISDYQNYLEKEWVKALKEKYPVNIKDKGLSYVYEKLEKK